MPADLIILALIAIFVLLRLRAVLGRKMGHEQSATPPRDGEEDRIVQVAPRPLPAPAPVDIEASLAATPEGLRDGVRDAMRLDPGFSLSEFVKGARIAFEMVLDAFHKDDRDTLKNLLSVEIYDHFRGELDSRISADRKPETTLVAILNATARSVEMRKTSARVTVAFESEQIQVVRDKTGKIVEGDAGQVDTVDDEWVFERDLKATNPNWKIVAT